VEIVLAKGVKLVVDEAEVELINWMEAEVTPGLSEQYNIRVDVVYENVRSSRQTRLEGLVEVMATLEGLSGAGEGED
jgi:hypothetical protein